MLNSKHSFSKSLSFAAILSILFVFLSCANDDDKKVGTANSITKTKDTLPDYNIAQFMNRVRDVQSLCNDSILRSSSSKSSASTAIMLLNKLNIEVLDIEVGVQKLTDSGEINQVKKECKNLSAIIAKLQNQHFPKYRQAYALAMRQKLWEENIDITTSGKRNEVINFIGGAFYSRKSIQAVQNAVQSGLFDYRFKESRFYSYKGSDSYFYPTNAPIDAAPILSIGSSL